MLRITRAYKAGRHIFKLYVWKEIDFQCIYGTPTTQWQKTQISWFKTWQRPWMDISSKNIYNSQWVYEKVLNIINKLLFSHYIVSNSLQSCELWHPRLLYPSLSPRACLNSCPLNQWYHPTISSCHPLFLLPSIFPSIRVLTNELFISGGQSVGAWASSSVPPMNIQGLFPLGLTGLISLKSKRLSRSSPALQFQNVNSSVLSFLYGPTLTSTHDYWKNPTFD